MKTIDKMKFNVQQVEQICPIHNVQMYSLMGRIHCAQCGLEKIEHEKQQDLQEREQYRKTRLLEIAQLPKRHHQCGFSNYITNPQNESAKATTMAYVKTILQGEIKNLVMVGSTGTGKTHLACAMAKNLLHHGQSVRYITTADLAEHIMLSWREDDKTQKGEIAKFADFDLLILDEYGLHDQQEKRLEIIHQVLYARYDKMKPTVIISNMTLEEFRNNLGDRLWSRLQHGGFSCIQANWGDYRL